MSHTRKDLETVDYECAMGDCAHEVRPCPSTGTYEVCQECTDRNWDEWEGGIITWDECQGCGAIWDEEPTPQPSDPSTKENDHA